MTFERKSVRLRSTAIVSRTGLHGIEVDVGDEQLRVGPRRFDDLAQR